MNYNILRIIKKICVIALPAVITGAVVMNAGCNKKFDAPPLESTDTPAVTMTIKELKAMHTVSGKYDTIQTAGVISGIVTANDSSGNFYQEIVIQDNTGGLPVMLNVTSGLYTTYPVGRKIFISVKGLILGDYGGSIQLGGGIYTNPSNGNKKVDGIASTLIDNYVTRGTFHNVVEPLHISDLSQIDTSMQSPQSNILVTLDSFEFPAVMLDSTYADTTASRKSRGFNLENCSGQVIELYNSGYANFASFKVPQGRGVITGIYTKFNSTKELLIRDTSDIKFYGTRCNGGGTTPTGGDTISISDVRKIGNGTIPANSIIKGIVVSNSANEAAGNYRLEAEDGSAGVILYFSTTPNPALTVGQEISVNVGGLTVAPYNGDLEIGKVPAATVLGTGSITPRTATIADIKNNISDWASTLVTIKNVTIKQGAASGNGINDTISDATGSIVTYIRNAANITPPDQASSITGYVSVYQPSGGTAVAQLGLRDQDDIVASSGGGGDTGTSDGAKPLFAGSDFENWTAFTGGLSSNGIQAYATQATGAGLDGSAALSINGTPAGNDYVFTALAASGYPSTPKAIKFYIKGTSGKSVSINVYKNDGTYYVYNLGTFTTAATLEPAGTNQYTGTINTGGEWQLVTLDVSGISDLNLTATDKSFFALKVGKSEAYDLLFDNFTIE